MRPDTDFAMDAQSKAGKISVKDVPFVEMEDRGEGQSAASLVHGCIHGGHMWAEAGVDGLSR